VSAREVHGYLDRKNAMNLARWRMRYAMTGGQDLADLREAVPELWQRRDWSQYDTPTYLRVPRKIEFPALLRKQAA
jgi:hypothetical protein